MKEESDLGTVLTVLGIVISVWALIQVVWITKQVLTWILVAVFFAIALSPAVDWLQRHGIRRRGYAVALTALAVAGVVAAIAWLVIPPLVGQVNDFARQVPDYVSDMTKGGIGRSGFTSVSNTTSTRPFASVTPIPQNAHWSALPQ